MAIPSLEYQIRYVDAILVVRAQSDKGSNRTYRVEEILKSRYLAPTVGETIQADLSIFELLGYPVDADQRVVVFLALKKNGTGYDCIDFLPERDGIIHYGQDDPSVYQPVTTFSLKELILKNKED